VRLCCGCGAPGLHPPSRRQVPRASVAQARARPCSRARADAARRGTETSSSTARGRCGECEQLRCAECAIDARIGSHRNASRCINDAHCHAVRRMRRFTAHRTAWRARRDTSQCSSDLSHFSYARSRSARYAIRSVTWSRHTRNSLGQTSRTEPHTGTHGEPNNKQTNATRAKCAGCARPFDSIGAKARRVSARRVSMHAGGTTDKRRGQPGRPTTSGVAALGGACAVAVTGGCLRRHAWAEHADGSDRHRCVRRFWMLHSRMACARWYRGFVPNVEYSPSSLGAVVAGVSPARVPVQMWLG
jgi:hypothetical protein